MLLGRGQKAGNRRAVDPALLAKSEKRAGERLLPQPFLCAVDRVRTGGGEARGDRMKGGLVGEGQPFPAGQEGGEGGRRPEKGALSPSVGWDRGEETTSRQRGRRSPPGGKGERETPSPPVKGEKRAVFTKLPGKK